MSARVAIAVVLALALIAVLVALRVRRHRRPTPVATATIADPEDHTVVDDSGAVRSVQAANLAMPPEVLDAIWTPAHLERLARTYWRFLARVTLGLIHVRYAVDGRDIVLLGRPFVLLRFQAPEYEIDAEHGLVRWRIERGLLVSRRGRGGGGHLQITVSRRPPAPDGRQIVHVECEVASFYPSIASGLSTWIYSQTQSRIHVIVTHSFLRSLARLDLAESKVGALTPAPAAPDAESA